MFIGAVYKSRGASNAARVRHFICWNAAKWPGRRKSVADGACPRAPPPRRSGRMPDKVRPGVGDTGPVLAANLGHTTTRMSELHYAHLAASHKRHMIRDTAPQFGVVAGGNVA